MTTSLSKFFPVSVLATMLAGLASSAAALDIGIHIGSGQPPDQAVTVLTRGPVHEAFAEPVVTDPVPGLVIPSRPPEPLAEVPPDEEPTNETAVWIPGYWSWDQDRQGFIWVSGTWRNPPPDFSWVPGYWTHVRSGYQWVPGFWAPVDTQEIEYLPAPPRAPDDTPSQPNPGRIWVPGTWYYMEDHYVWRPGYWLEPHEGWTWVPSHYVWTPRGYIFLQGHWDHWMNRRGILFTPVAFEQPVYTQPDFTYTPSIVVDTTALISNLFCQPRYYHYYFGDYYDTQYINQGIYPNFQFQSRRSWYDPIYLYRDWRQPGWIEQRQHDYDYSREHREARPARTYAQMERATQNLSGTQREQATLARPLQQVSAHNAENLRFKKLTEERRNEIVQQRQRLHDYRQERSGWETGSRTVPAQAQPGAAEGRGRAGLPAPPKEAPAPEAGKPAAPPPQPQGAQAQKRPGEAPSPETPQRPETPQARPPTAPETPTPQARPPEATPPTERPEAGKPPEAPARPAPEARPPAERPEAPARPVPEASPPQARPPEAAPPTERPEAGKPPQAPARPAPEARPPAERPPEAARPGEPPRAQPSAGEAENRKSERVKVPGSPVGGRPSENAEKAPPRPEEPKPEVRPQPSTPQRGAESRPG